MAHTLLSDTVQSYLPPVKLATGTTRLDIPAPRTLDSLSAVEYFTSRTGDSKDSFSV